MEQDIAESYSLFHHSLVTSNRDALKFYAAASLQLQNAARIKIAAKSDSGLITSPFNLPSNLLDLKSLDIPDQLVAKAFTIFQPTRDDYATAPYTESFNWSAIIAFLRTLSQAQGHHFEKKDYYIVTFRSRLHADADMELMDELDVHSHREATASGGLLKYWFGTPNKERENVATCIWRSKADASLGGRGPWHIKAKASANQIYEHITFSMLKLVIRDGATGWEISNWDLD